MCEQCRRRDEELRWFVMLVRQGLKLIVAGIESRYGLNERRADRAA